MIKWKIVKIPNLPSNEFSNLICCSSRCLYFFLSVRIVYTWLWYCSLSRKLEWKIQKTKNYANNRNLLLQFLLLHHRFALLSHSQSPFGEIKLNRPLRLRITIACASLQQLPDIVDVINHRCVFNSLIVKMKSDNRWKRNWKYPSKLIHCY